MKIVFDTNVILSALITQGLSSRVLDLCIEKHLLYISPFIIDEVTQKLKNKFNVGAVNIRKTKSFLLASFELKKPGSDIPHICRDRDDDNILALAREVGAHIIITGDRDLLDMKSFDGTGIITPREFIEKYHTPH